MTDGYSLPFALNEKAIYAWLSALRRSGLLHGGQQLNQILTQLRSQPIPHKQKLLVLQELIAECVAQANSLAAGIENLPSIAKTDKIARLSMSLLKNLSVTLYELIESDQLNDQQKAICGYYALQLVGQYWLQCCLLRQLPAEKMWQISGEIYRYAYDHQALTQEVSHASKELNPLLTMERVTKRNLLFALCSGFDLSPADFHHWFEFANKHADQITLKRGMTRPDIFIWDTAHNHPIELMTPGQPLNEATLEIDCTVLHDTFNTTQNLAPFSSAAALCIRNNLTSYKKLMHDTIPATPVIQNMLIGLKPIYNFLAEQSKIEKILALGSEAEYLRPRRQIGLAHETETHALDSLDLHRPQKLNVKLLKTSDLRYVIVETASIEVGNGEIILLIDGESQLGIVRQQQVSQNFQTRRLLVERIPGRVTAHSAHYAGGGQDVLIIDENGDKPQLLTMCKKLRNSDTLTFDGVQARIIKLFEFTSLIVRYHITKSFT